MNLKMEQKMETPLHKLMGKTTKSDTDLESANAAPAAMELVAENYRAL
ncbi:hypothetical protein EDD76_102102 [Kineothrix alysoides]|uniref:Uncharacterized protein n=1 Tax=Kineothrix alysoides TaxID=1469948 RepID=A0A4R1R4H9_9FIRM|nr:hypothetical protein [Kineothrix alysoides]TCL60406.1 hypothetical protein EDD76_102102 [Kineothrix alysoides]